MEWLGDKYPGDASLPAHEYWWGREADGEEVRQYNGSPEFWVMGGSYVVDPLAGPFNSLEAAKAAYIVIRASNAQDV